MKLLNRKVSYFLRIGLGVNQILKNFMDEFQAIVDLPLASFIISLYFDPFEQLVFITLCRILPSISWFVTMEEREAWLYDLFNCIDVLSHFLVMFLGKGIWIFLDEPGQEMFKIWQSLLNILCDE